MSARRGLNHLRVDRAWLSNPWRKNKRVRHSEWRTIMSLITFHRIYPSAIPPMRGDKSALGSLPAAAFQYCEAIRTASSFGWYVFPPLDIELKVDGAEVFCFAEDSGWNKLSSLYFEDEFWREWDRFAPDDMKGYRIPYLTTLFVPGIVQIWSGLLVSTASDYSVLVRPLANVVSHRGYQVYEGIVETDRFAPCPLFMNIRLIDTSRAIEVYQRDPLFQVQAIHRSCYADGGAYAEKIGLGPPDGVTHGMSATEWDGLRSTIRSAQPLRDSQIGRYGAAVRKRAKGQENID